MTKHDRKAHIRIKKQKPVDDPHDAPVDALWEPEKRDGKIKLPPLEEMEVTEDLYFAGEKVDARYTPAEPQPPTHIIRISPFLHFSCTGKVPNRFHRWMMKRFFGWEVDVL